MPSKLAAALEPGITTITTSNMELLDAGPGRYLQLQFVDTADGAPAVSYSGGRAPGPSRAGRSRDPEAEPEDGSWPMQVAVSQEAADALGLEVGDRVPARDEQGRKALIQISGTFVADDEDDEAWQVASRVLHPVSGTSEGARRTSATALVSAESLPDLRYALLRGRRDPPGRLRTGPLPRALARVDLPRAVDRVAAVRRLAGQG